MFFSSFSEVYVFLLEYQYLKMWRMHLRCFPVCVLPICMQQGWMNVKAATPRYRGLGASSGQIADTSDTLSIKSESAPLLKHFQRQRILVLSLLVSHVQSFYLPFAMIFAFVKNNGTSNFADLG